MELGKKFQQVTSSRCVHTEFGDRPKVPNCSGGTRGNPIRPHGIIYTRGFHRLDLKVFLPRRYKAAVSETDIQDINSRKVSLCLISRGRCKASRLIYCLLKSKTPGIYNPYVINDIERVLLNTTLLMVCPFSDASRRSEP